MKTIALTMIALLAACVSEGLTAASEATTANSIRIEVVDLHSDQGTVNCALFRTPDGFPDDYAKAFNTESEQISGQKAVCSFASVVAGDYAVAVYHDENANGKLDRNFMGIPKEGVGASNDAKGRFGPPKFDDARFAYQGGTMTLTIHVRYLLAPM